MVQIVKLKQGQTLTENNILQYLTRARNGYDYCRFEFKFGTYITIAFFKDLSYDIMTNSRNLSLWNDIQLLRRQPGITALVPYVCRWIKVYNA